MSLEWSPRAEHDLLALKSYIAEDSPLYARQFAERLIHTVETLPLFPRKGRTVPEMGFRDDIREVLFQGYRIIYRLPTEDRIEIITVVHGARDLRKQDVITSDQDS